MTKEKKKQVGLLIVAVLLWAFIVWFSLGYDADAQEPYYPHVRWGQGTAPWYYYTPSYRAPADCFNYYGAHVPCAYPVTYGAWR